jgi:hypothetical protein
MRLKKTTMDWVWSQDGRKEIHTEFWNTATTNAEREKEDIIKVELKEVGCEGGRWMEVWQDQIR